MYVDKNGKECLKIHAWLTDYPLWLTRKSTKSFIILIYITVQMPSTVLSKEPAQSHDLVLYRMKAK